MEAVHVLEGLVSALLDRMQSDPRFTYERWTVPAELDFRGTKAMWFSY